ncbi:MAG: hypothetical protein WBW62_12100 [Solirubrobacterales bacterium]
MGILDEAIREHLELKRQHGAEEEEIEGLENQAFGPADRPDAVEAETEIISPGSSLTAPAGEGDQLDKVFEATREAEAASEELTAETTAENPVADEVPAASTAEAAPLEADAQPEPEVASTPDESPDTGDSPSAEVKAPQPPEPEEDGDAGDALQQERVHLSDHPTEHYDVDAAIAEEDEIDILSESSLSDELDRALDGPSEPAPAAAERSEVSEAEVADEDPISDEFEHVFDDEPENEVTQAPVEDAGAEVEEEEVATEGDADFFDQEDPLEATPDFLEETPEHDRLWFEQKPPKDFEFGD